MRYPLDGNPVITTEFKAKPDPGTFGVHTGLDWRARTPLDVHAPGSGVVTQSYTASSGNQIIEVRIGKYLWRFLHLSKRNVSKGQSVTEGQVIGKTGATGGVAPHLHADVRFDGTSWNASINNYVDPRWVITTANEKHLSIQINPGTWNVRTGAGTGSPSLGVAYGGQKYGPAAVMSNGWGQIVFTGRVGYVAPSAFKKI